MVSYAQLRAPMPSWLHQCRVRQMRIDYGAAPCSRSPAAILVGSWPFLRAIAAISGRQISVAFSNHYGKAVPVDQSSLQPLPEWLLNTYLILQVSISGLLSHITTSYALTSLHSKAENASQLVSITSASSAISIKRCSAQLFRCL